MNNGALKNGPAPSPMRPSLMLGGLHLAVLWAFAFQKPLFDILGRNPEFFVVRGNTRGDIIAFALLFTFVPPLLMLAAEWVALRIRRPLYEGLHLALVAVLAAAIVLQVLKDIASGPAGALIAVALAAGTLLAFAYARTVFANQALSFLSPVPVLFLLLFLLFSPVHKLVLPQKEAKASDVEVKSQTPVVMLVLDELPTASLMDDKGRIDAGRFPGFAELAKSSTWYRNTTTVAGFTTRAVPGILTAKDPGDRLPIASDQPDSVFTLLGRSYRMNVNETATAICPAKVCGGKEITAVGGAAREEKESKGRFRTRMRQLVSDLSVVSEHLLLPDGIAEHLPAVDQTFGGFQKGGDAASGDAGGADGGTSGNAEQVQVGETIRKGAFTNRPETFAAFVAGLRNSPKTFNFLHSAFPHFPWLYLPGGGKRYVPKAPDIALNDGVWPKNDYFVAYGQQRHLLQTIYTDELLASMIKRLKKTGLWDRAIVVVTADHGGSFIPGQRRRDPEPATMGEIAPVPFFFKAPGQKSAEVDDAHRCTTDVIPMIVEALGVDFPFERQECSERVTVAQYNGQPTSLGLDQVLQQRDEAVRRRLEIFGRGGGIAPLFRFGPEPQLIGRPISSLPRVTGTGGVELLGSFDYDPGGATIPALVQGTLSDVKAGEPLAVAVNGTVVTTAEAFPLLGKLRIAATLPQRSLRPGANPVEIFKIVGSGSGARLQSLGGTV